MAYITKEQVAEKRNAIKAAFPASKGWKFSIRLQDYSSISVTILQGPVEFRIKNKNPAYENDYYARRDEMFGTTPITDVQVNKYNTDCYDAETKKVIDKLNEIIEEGNYNNSRPEVDYFDVGWWSSLKIGDYNNNYKYFKNT